MYDEFKKRVIVERAANKIRWRQIADRQDAVADVAAAMKVPETVSEAYVFTRALWRLTDWLRSKGYFSGELGSCRRPLQKQEGHDQAAPGSGNMRAPLSEGINATAAARKAANRPILSGKQRELARNWLRRRQKAARAWGEPPPDDAMAEQLEVQARLVEATLRAVEAHLCGE